MLVVEGRMTSQLRMRKWSAQQQEIEENETEPVIRLETMLHEFRWNRHCLKQQEERGFFERYSQCINTIQCKKYLDFIIAACFSKQIAFINEVATGKIKLDELHKFVNERWCRLEKA